MNNANATQFVIGLPGAGKTTFLAALWHVVVSGDVEGALELSHLSSDKEYLNRIRDDWADVRELERTKLDHEHTVSMILRRSQSEASTEVFFPDLSGESFELQWTHRTMTKEFAAILREATGGLLLIHPTAREERLIAQANPLVDIIDASRGLEDEEGSNDVAAREGDNENQNSVRKWEPRLAPTQVQLVDLLQFVDQFATRRPLRLAVIVSAWDLVQEASPNSWIGKRLPLLYQYLTANQDAFTCQYFGISGQGGDLEKDAARLRALSEPSQRIEVVTDGNEPTCDITLPVRWTMNWE